MVNDTMKQEKFIGIIQPRSQKKQLKSSTNEVA